MSIVAKDFTDTGVSNSFRARPGESMEWEVSGTFVGTWVLEKKVKGGAAYEQVETGTGTDSGTIAASEHTDATDYRFRCSDYTSGTISTEMADVAGDTVELWENNGTDVLKIRDDGIQTPAIFTQDGVGAANGTGVSVSEQIGAVRRTTVTFEDVAIALTDEAGVVAYGGLKFYDAPEGAIIVLGALADLDITKSSAGVNDDWDGDFSIGTVTASSNGTLTSTEANVIASTATPQASAGATTANGQSTGSECPLYLDGTTTPADLFLNFLVDDADHDVGATACNLIVNGTIDVLWVNMGDY